MLGSELLYNPSSPVLESELGGLKQTIADLNYRDMEFAERVMYAKDSLSELMQHEYDHLAILATMRAIDSKSFYLKSDHV